MDITHAIPQQRTTAPILAISILLGILLFPAFERALMKWMPIASQSAPTQPSAASSAWDPRAMWY
jgi:hypothetical protein